MTRWLNRRVLLIAVTACFVIMLVWAWVTQTGQNVTCNFAPAKFSLQKDYKGYIEINLKRQHPTEPYFDGELWFVYADETQKAFSSLPIGRSGARTYGNFQSTIQTAWNETFRGLTPRAGSVPFDLITTAGLHQYFPFDSAKFDFTLTLGPGLTQQIFRVSNRVPGFVLPCNSLKVSPQKSGALQVSFALKRSPLIQLFVVVLCLALVVFLVLILQIKDTGALPTAVASYFFSALTLRTIVSDQIKMFPTLFDCFILSLSMAMIVALLWIVHRPAKRDSTVETKKSDRQKGETKKS
jgi:hypothetical protein